LLLVSGYSIIRGKSRLEAFKYTISTDLLQRAIAVFFFTLTLITIGIFLLALFEPNIAFVDLMFEEVSAFCNVGLSLGITAELSTPSRIIIMLSMLIGRMGALTLAFVLLKPKRFKNYQYPSAHITVG
jgi:Trk-type K+ transport system membrane component